MLQNSMKIQESLKKEYMFLSMYMSETLYQDFVLDNFSINLFIKLWLCNTDIFLNTFKWFLLVPMWGGK